MEDILKAINMTANNVEEICCGIHNFPKYYKIKENRDKFIEELENEMLKLNELIDQLKKLDDQIQTN